jgi:hypothetical protein
VFWSSGTGIWGAPSSSAPNSNLAKVVLFDNVGFQDRYIGTWTYNNRFYIILGEQNTLGRVFEVASIPSSAATVTLSTTDVASGGHRTGINSGSGWFASAIHTPFSGDADGLIMAAGTTNGLSTWRRTSPNWSQRGTWSIPTCDGVGCFRFSPGSSHLLPMQVGGRTIAAFGATNGRLVIVDAMDETFFRAPEVLTAGAGSVMAIASTTINGRVYLFYGSTLGLLFQFDALDRRIVNLAVLSSPSVATLTVHSVLIDAPTGAIYAAGGDGSYFTFVSRISADASSMSVFDFEALPTQSADFFTGSARALLLDTSRNRIYVGTDQQVSKTPVTVAWDRDSVIYEYIAASCSRYSCETCGVVDSAFCGYCSGTSTCVMNGACPGAEGPFTRPPACPTVTGLSRTAGSLSGGSQVSFQGTGFYAGSNKAGRYSCFFGGQPGTVDTITATAVSCSTPAGSSSVEVSAELRYNNVPIRSTSTLTWKYVDCTALTCSTCFTDGAGDCVWCMRAGSCTGAASCAGPSSTTACPALQSVSNSISTGGPTNQFSLQSTILPAGETYRCNIGGQSAPLVSTSGTAVQCTRPASITAITTAPYVEILDQSTWRRFTQPRANDPTIEVYDCNGIAACFPCISGHQDCAFCSSGTCSYNTTSSSCSTLTAGCPRVDTIQPSRLHYSADGASDVRANIVGLGPTSTAGFRCIWTANNGTVILNAPVVNASITTVFCAVPSGNLSLPSVGLEIWNFTTALTNRFAVPIYDCSAGTRCTACADSTRPRCQWCNVLLLCEAPSALPGGTCPGVSAGCPTMVATPNQEPTSGGRTIIVIPTPFPPAASDAECIFSGPESTTSVIALSNGTAFRCVAPRSPFAQAASLSLLLGGTEYATPVPFTYFDCTFASLGVPRSCSDCVQRSGCGWCGASCSPAASCQTPLSTCPVITALGSQNVDAESPEFVSVDTNPLPPNDFEYECVFGTQRVPASTTPTGLRCLTPQSALVGSAEVRVAVKGNSVGFWTTDATPDTIDFYRCSLSARQCGSQCFSSSQYCGYCLETGSCSGKAACARAITASGSGLSAESSWFNETTGCPAIGDFAPNYVQATIRSRPPIFQRVTFKVSNIILPAVNATGKRSIGLSDFTCAFGSDVSPVDSYDPATNSFSCPIPSLGDQGFYSVAVSLRGNRMNGDNPPRLQVQDCFSIPACGLCLLQPNCGWCRGSARCMTKAWCDAEPIPEFGSQCPTLNRVSPATAVISGDVTVTITGGPFVNSTLLYARMDYPSNISVELPTTVVDSNTLSVLIPKSANDYEGEVKILVFINGTAYTGSELTFTYLALSSLAGGIATSAIGGIIGAAVAVIVALIVVLLIMRSKKVGFFSQFRLKEPDYSLIAFGSMLQPQWKPPKDNWEILAIKLLAKDHGFVLTVMATTPPTDQDKIARALCHVYEWHKKSVEYGVLFVTDEVSRNLEENTIFRNNSMASKWFKFYSKIIGIKYLFDHLARFVYELNKISEEKTGRTEDTTGGKSLLTLEMEVDPSKFGNDAFTDSEANVYQLILACQKVFTAFRTSIGKIPPEFKEIFSSMRESIVNKFKSDDAVLKAVGGFFFLRFACPAITAPHAYGLLENPPNESSQRQLVLIGKVIQNLANMTMPGTFSPPGLFAHRPSLPTLSLIAF